MIQNIQLRTLSTKGLFSSCSTFSGLSTGKVIISIKQLNAIVARISKKRSPSMQRISEMLSSVPYRVKRIQFRRIEAARTILYLRNSRGPQRSSTLHIEKLMIEVNKIM
uniref:(northern house mosquito) hypothetical protein n=1 Tax=Culex pipiens TaxID=7175 RepID=A0A8D8DNF5_CULPI